MTAPLVYRVCGKCRDDLDVQSDGESVPDEVRGQPRLQVAAGVGVGHAGGPEGNSPDLTRAPGSVGEEPGMLAGDALPAGRGLANGAQPLVFLADPPHHGGVDAGEERMQLGAVRPV